LHFMKIQDGSISRQFLGEPELWTAEGWAARTGVNIDKGGREETVEEMQGIRVQDWDAYREYQARVIERTTQALAGVDRTTLEAVVLPRLPEHMRQIYCALVVGDGPVRKLEVV